MLGRRYVILTSEGDVSANQAKANCLAIGKEIASVSNEDDLNAMREAFDIAGISKDTARVWIGLVRDESNDIFSFEDGTVCPYDNGASCIYPSDDSTSIIRWSSGQPSKWNPDGSFEGCTELGPKSSGDPNINDMPCTATGYSGGRYAACNM